MILLGIIENDPITKLAENSHILSWKTVGNCLHQMFFRGKILKLVCRRVPRLLKRGSTRVLFSVVSDMPAWAEDTIAL